MDKAYTIIIGLEVHVQLMTRTKLFCGCPNEFGLPPNTAVCPVCLGHAGTLPVLNRRAFELALRAAAALNCQLAGFTKWDRKNYWYPDLPKNFQISQYDLPFSRDGWLEIPSADGNEPHRIGIIRVHLEEDAGKLLHQGQETLVDLNRAGTPLLEIVSRPDIRSPEEAKSYLEEIRLLMKDLRVSDCEMQEGSLRCDANINLHIPRDGGGTVATPIVEVKNLNSFRAVERALRYEAERQYREYRDTGITLEQGGKATAGWDEDREITVVQRRKEQEADYRYFPEPDLPPVVVTKEWMQEIRDGLGELPGAARRRLQSQHGLSYYDADLLVRQGRAFVAYFDAVAEASGDAKAAANWLSNQVLNYLNQTKTPIGDFPLAPQRLGQIIRKAKEVRLPKKKSEELFEYLLRSPVSVEQAMSDLRLEVLSDEDQLRAIVRQAIAENAQAIEDYRKGKTKALDRVKGAIMRQAKGMADFQVVQRLLLEELSD